jgi:hypothetical protein
MALSDTRPTARASDIAGRERAGMENLPFVGWDNVATDAPSHWSGGAVVSRGLVLQCIPFAKY